MVFYIIGLGLGDEKDITVRGLEAVRSSSKVYLEYYTSLLGVDKILLVRYGLWVANHKVSDVFVNRLA